MKNLSVYIHWPFCESKCPYCDFNSHVRESIKGEAWLKAYLKEIEYFSDYIKNKKIVSVFFGGGTPSLMPVFIAEEILSKLYPNFLPDVEISMEANPSSVEASKFSRFKSAGINRVSLGIQSFDDESLKFLGRAHNAKEAIGAIELAKDIFDRFSFDLIYARPDQTIDEWVKELEFALEFGAKHMSLYQLTIEKGTRFFSEYKNKKFLMPEENLSADFFDKTNQIMEQNNLRQYEISNYASSGQECRHNLTYWRYGDYLGIGPGAHSRTNNTSMMMIHNPEGWLKSVQEKGCGIQQEHKLSKEEILSEILLMGLRIKEGISDKIFQTQFGKNAEELFELDYLIDTGFIEKKENLKATERGMMVLNEVIIQLKNRFIAFPF